MANHQVNVLVDVQAKLSEPSREALLNELGALRGVLRASVSFRSPRLVFVDYDPYLTDSQRILGAVTGRGLDARLVGM